VVDVAEEVRHRDRLDELDAGIGLRQALAVDIDLDVRRDVDESEVDAGQHQDDEAEERHLAEEEGAVDRKRLAAVVSGDPPGVDPPVEPPAFPGRRFPDRLPP
jgi:hypothetical protein